MSLVFRRVLICILQSMITFQYQPFTYCTNTVHNVLLPFRVIFADSYDLGPMFIPAKISKPLLTVFRSQGRRRAGVDQPLFIHTLVTARRK